MVVDSGGTGTQWGCVMNGELVYVINSTSLHPKFQSDWYVSDVKKELIDNGISFLLPLYFYGAGCGNPEAIRITKDYLLKEDFNVAAIQTDALGACRAVCDETDGYVAILGTGSILLDYSNGKIGNRYGGFGSMLGDEGSGFYFGKLLIQSWLKNDERLNVNKEALEKVLGSKETIMSRINQPDFNRWLAQLAKNVPSDLVEHLHRTNSQAFLDAYLPKMENGTLNIIGSYGFNMQHIIASELEKRNWKLGNCYASPMDGLVVYHNKLINQGIESPR